MGLLIARTLSVLLSLYMWILIGRMVLSWVPLLVPGWRPKGFMLVICEAIYTLTDPPLNFVGRFIRPIRMGSIGLDIGFIVVFFAVIMAQRLVWILA